MSVCVYMPPIHLSIYLHSINSVPKRTLINIPGQCIEMPLDSDTASVEQRTDSILI